MEFKTYSSPHLPVANSVSAMMLRVLLALVPGIICALWIFGWGILFNRAQQSPPLGMIGHRQCGPYGVKIFQAPGNSKKDRNNQRHNNSNTLPPIPAGKSHLL